MALSRLCSSKKSLSVNEFAFRWNTRNDADAKRLETFDRRIEGLTYRQVAQP